MTRHNVPIITSTLFLLGTIALLELICLAATGFNFCYPLDDTFIHMGVAKTLANSGVWGVTPAEWVSASSSPLYTLLLTLCFKIFGVQIIIPFIIATFGSIAALWIMHRELLPNTMLSTNQKLITILMVTLLGALASLSVLGMEHTLQTAFSLAFVFLAGTILVRENPERHDYLLLCAVAAAMVMTRYENIFLVAVGGVGIWIRHGFMKAFLLGAFTILPVVVFGWVMWHNGSFFLPNSILIKGNQDSQILLKGQHALLSVTRTITGLLVIAAMIMFTKVKASKYDRDFWMLTMFFFTGVLHSVFAAFGWFFRYEAYLIVVGSFLIIRIGFEGMALEGLRKLAPRLILGFCLLINYTLFARAGAALVGTKLALYNIFDQQVQMGRFTKSYYDHAAVAANDIGAISFYSNAKIIDLWGLGNNAVTHARREDRWSAGFIDSLTRSENCKMIVIYDSWFERSQNHPSNWVKVATWTMPYNYICGDIFVTYYALTPQDADVLKNALMSFSPRLPHDVKVEYLR